MNSLVLATFHSLPSPCALCMTKTGNIQDVEKNLGGCVPILVGLVCWTKKLGYFSIVSSTWFDRICCILYCSARYSLIGRSTTFRSLVSSFICSRARSSAGWQVAVLVYAWVGGLLMYHERQLFVAIVWLKSNLQLGNNVNSVSESQQELTGDQLDIFIFVAIKSASAAALSSQGS